MITVNFLPYGRVDAIVIHCDGQTAFIDGGYRADGARAVEFMRKILDINDIDCYIATHRHRNHIGAAPVIISEMRPREVYTADERMQARIKSLARAAEREAISETVFWILDGSEAIPLGGATIRMIAPDKIRKCSAGSLTENYNSMVLRVDYGKASLLLTGDTSSAILEAADKRERGCISAGLCKNAHHNGQMSVAALKAINPMAMVVCNGKPISSYYRARLDRLGIGAYTACKLKNGGDGEILAVAGDDDPGWRIMVG